MEKTGKNYKVASISSVQELERATVNEALSLTGSEISVNQLPAGVSVPFVHSHKRNEEVYIILSGKGVFYIDGDEFEVGEGDVVRIDPAGERCIKADEQGAIKFICIQTEANSLVQFTLNDGLITETKPSWL